MTTHIHKEGYSILFVMFFVLLGIVLVSWLILPNWLTLLLASLSLLLFFFIMRFFRVPQRHFQPNEHAVFSPADGTIVAIEEVEETEYFGTRCIQVSVFMSIWNVHINWFPVSGTVTYFNYHPGDYLVAWHPKSSSHNERTSVAVKRPDGVHIFMRQIAGAVARRIVCYAEVGKAVEQCSELGFIKFGSRVDVFLPLNAKINVNLGQKVTGNLTVLAEV